MSMTERHDVLHVGLGTAPRRENKSTAEAVPEL